MPNVTVQVSPETYRSARIWCARNNTNVSKAVRQILESLPNLSPGKIANCHSANSAAQAAAAKQSENSLAPAAGCQTPAARRRIQPSRPNRAN